MARRSARELKAAVRRGVVLLDEKMPNLWRRVLRTPEFDFSRSCKCVVGVIGACQLLAPETGNNWDKGSVALGLDRSRVTGQTDAQRYGFDWVDSSEGPLLQKYWKTVIRGGTL